MPGIIPRYDPNDKTVNELANMERKKRISMIDAAWTYYREGGIRKPLKVRQGQPDDNVMLALSAQAIDKAVAFFAPSAPRFVIPGGVNREPGASGALEIVKKPEQIAIERFLTANQFNHQIVDIALSGFIGGHNFLRLFMPDNTHAISPENPPRMSLLDPRFVTKFWDISDIQHLLWYRMTWNLGGDLIRRQDIVPTWLVKQGMDPQQKPDPELGWEIIEYQGKGEAQDFKEVARDHWDYPFAPLVDWKNSHAPHECYGESDLIHADLNDSINFVASNIARILKFHAAPKTIGKGVDPNQIKTTSIDGFWTIPESGDVINLEMQSDLASSLTYLDTLRSAFFAQTHVVDTASIKDKVGALTNFAVRMLYKDQLDRNTMKQSLYGSGIGETIYRAALMMRLANIEKPNAEWDDPLPSDRLEVVKALEVEKKLGTVSTQTAQEDLKRDPVVEAERMAEETNNTGDGMVGILDKLSKQGVFA